MQTEIKTLKEVLQQKINNKTKPIGALGQLEDIALQVGLIQESQNPEIIHPHIIVFAGDHGIAKTGLVSAYPQEVTAQMVLNFLSGGAAINVFCRQHNIVLKVVDAGVNLDWNDSITDDNFINASIGPGTKNYLDELAMSAEDVQKAMEEGSRIVEKIFAFGCNTIGFGEMGIGNTSSASLIMSAITGIPIEECVGKGAGVNDDQLQTKMHTLKSVFDKHRSSLSTNQPIEILTAVGGFEIAMMTGAYLKAADLKMIIVVDGFISTSALLCARLFQPNISAFCIFAHNSGEQGHEKMLAYLKARPVLNIGLRLGEGTGAALVIPLIQSSVNFFNEMATFDSAGISNK